jgi:two-component SAPR family response regulator
LPKRDFPNLILKGIFNPWRSLTTYWKERIDILFLDIDILNINGLDFRKKKLEVTVCIYISTYRTYAVESFELETLNIVVKPIKVWTICTNHETCRWVSKN